MYRIRQLHLSNFRSVLEMLGDLPDDGSPSQPGARVLHGMWRSSDQVQYAFDSITPEDSAAPLDRVAREYGEMPHTGQGTADAPRASDAPRRVAGGQSVAEELGLRDGLSDAELRRIRRDFAARNHPDRVPLSQRDEATQRMTMANVLIDRALKRKAARG